LNIKERIITVIEHFESGTKKTFAEKIGVPVTTLQNIVGTRSSDPTFNILNRIISAYPDVSLTWLMTGEGSITEKENTISYTVNEKEEGYKKPPNNKNDCQLCNAKDEIILSLKQQIKIQSEYLEVLKECCSQKSGEQKRKAG
jgi:hypothetical protein